MNRRPVTVAAGLIAAISTGAMMALQTRGNGELGRVWHDPYAAALWSFATGLILVLGCALLLRGGRIGLRRLVSAVRRRELPPWALLGGLVGGSFVLAQASVSPLLGVALFTVGTVAGQSLGGMLIDRLGIGPGGVRTVSPTRLVGGLAMILAVMWGASAGFLADAPVLAMAVPFVIGVAMGWQHAANGRVRQATGSALIATLGNFAIGTAALAAIFGGHALLVAGPRLGPAPPWVYLGGLIGVLYITAASILVNSLGVLLLSLGQVTGQVLGSLLVDQFLPAVPHAITAATLGSAVLTVLAVGITAIPSRWPVRTQPDVPPER